MARSLRKRICEILVAIVAAGLLSETLSALGVSTHRLVNRHAALTSESLDIFLRDSLGFHNGVTTNVRSGSRLRSVREWLEEGGEREDDLLRFLRHFHDPLKLWDTAGLDLGIGRYDSALRWMQDASQGGISTGGLWSWRDARRLYYAALTESDPIRREELWADLFRALGQIMHLVVDASVPEHTRNDIHPLGGLKLENSYERWVDSQHGAGNPDSEAQFIARYLSAPIGFVSDILGLAPPEDESVAKVPIARLIDADRYDGSNSGVTVDSDDYRAPVSVGLAEIANANFYSEDTLRGQYPSPTDEGLIPVNLTTPLGRVRRYLSRPAGQGLLPANPLRAECAGNAFSRLGQFTRPAPYPCTDALVWSQVAAHMLPRAVGYARGVLDYFFRGSMRVHTLYADAGKAFIRIENLTDEPMEGVFDVYSRPMATTAHEGREHSGLVNGGAAATVGPKATVTLPVTLLPVEHPTASQILVFRGRLGLEQDAVAAQVFEVRHVLITQTAHTAVMSETCDALDYYSNENGYFCNWRGVSHDVQGDLLADAAVPVIARVSAAWELTAGKKSAQIELDGIPIPDGVWQRQGTEPDPRRFRIIAGANQGNRLVLRVQLVSGDTVATPMAVLAFADASTRNYFTNPTSFSDPGPWYIAAERTATTQVFVHPPFRTLTIGGHLNPTNVRLNRFSDSRLQEYLTVNDIGSPRGALYRQRWIDDAEVFTTAPPGGPIALRQVLTQRLPTMPVSPLPVVLMEAEVERVYEPVELEFLKAFVTRVVPPSTFTVTGRLQPGT